MPTIERDPAVPAVVDTIEHLFGEVWSRGHLTTRDRRLIALGATTMLGRQDLLETQLRGALTNGELTPAQLREIEYFINYYASVENGTAILYVVEKLIAEHPGA
nr:carboxymuconolactone decarboxylase family protein [Planctomonas sp. JC2975]